MNNAEGIQRLRDRLLESVNVGFVDAATADLLISAFKQIIEDAERQRIACARQIEALNRQIAVAEGQMNGFSSFASVVYQTMNGYIRLAEQAHEKDQEKLAQAQAEAEEAAAKAIIERPYQEDPAELPAPATVKKKKKDKDVPRDL